MGFLKLTLTGLSLLAGSFFLYEGLGTNFRILDEGEIDLEPYGISIGIAFLVIGVLIEKLWPINWAITNPGVFARRRQRRWL